MANRTLLNKTAKIVIGIALTFVFLATGFFVATAFVRGDESAALSSTWHVQASDVNETQKSYGMDMALRAQP